MSTNKKEKMQVFQSPDDADTKDSILPTKASEKKRNEDISTRDIHPASAFEKFAYKVFDTSNVDFSDAVVKHRIRQISSSRSEFGVMGQEKHFESPLEKYSRLKDEVQNFIKELESLAKSQDNSKSSEVIRDISRLLSRDLFSLDQELNNVLNDKRIRPYLQSHLPLDLNSAGAVVADKEVIGKLISQIQSLSLQSKDGKEAKTITIPSSATSATSATTATAGPIDNKPDFPTYEIYYKGSANGNEMDPSTLSQIDRRLAQLEKTVGSAEEAANSFPDIQAGLRYLTRKIEFLDTSKLDKIYSRIKNITTELETLEAIKNKTNPQAQSSQHDEKIESLYTLVTRWDTTAQQVPHIVSRLQSLREIHEESANALIRLEAVEKQAETLTVLLNDDKNALMKVGQNFSDNMKVLESNISSLGDRFNTIAEKIEKLQKLKAIKL